MSVQLVRNTANQLITIPILKNVLFWYTVYRWTIKVWRHVMATGWTQSLKDIYIGFINRVFALSMYIPSVRKKVNAELDKATIELAEKLAPVYPECPPVKELPQAGLSADEIDRQLTALSQLPNTKWEDGKVSGAVYHGGPDMARIWTDAFAKFAVSNPIHADVFPGVRQMEASVLQMVLKLFNAPVGRGLLDDGACGTTTSGGTESILMATKTYRDRARALYGITEPEMIVPITAHPAFDKAASYFRIKIHHIPVDAKTRKVDIARVKRAINPNTIMLVGSAPNYGDGIIDDIRALSKLAIKASVGLHVDCCLGSFIMPFLEKAGFPSEPFDFRVPGVTSISCDTHKYGFAPKGSSIIMYRSKSIRKFQYEVVTGWTGGVYASPSAAGSRPGAVIAGAYATMLHMGYEGYLASAIEIVNARAKIENAIRQPGGRFPELVILGKPLASVVAFTFADDDAHAKIYEVGDKLSKLGWHLAGLQNPPGLHIACTKLTVGAVDSLLDNLRTALDEVKLSADGSDKGGSMVQIYGLGSSSSVGPGLVEQMTKRYLDCLYE